MRSKDQGKYSSDLMNDQGAEERDPMNVCTNITKAEAAILSELGECVNMLSRLQLALSDIIELTEANSNDTMDHADDITGKADSLSLSRRMDILLSELQEWDKDAMD